MNSSRKLKRLAGEGLELLKGLELYYRRDLSGGNLRNVEQAYELFRMLERPEGSLSECSNSELHSGIESLQKELKRSIPHIPNHRERASINRLRRILRDIDDTLKDFVPAHKDSSWALSSTESIWTIRPIETSAGSDTMDLSSPPMPDPGTIRPMAVPTFPHQNDDIQRVCENRDGRRSWRRKIGEFNARLIHRFVANVGCLGQQYCYYSHSVYERLSITRLRMISVFTALGLREEDIPHGHKRVRWTNGRGKKLFDDYVEHEPGAAHALQVFLSSAAYAATNTLGSNHQRSASDFESSRCHNASPWFSSVGSGDIADHRYDRDIESEQSAAAQEELELADMRLRSLHLFACTNKGRHAFELHQRLITHVSDDRELFRELRRIFYEHRGRFKPYWSLTTVHSIHFMKFAYGGPRYVDVRCHDELCESGKSCECIPPGYLVYPLGLDYECRPVPAKLSPPLGKRLMMDFFTDPEGIEPNRRLVIEQLPKRRSGELQVHASDEFEHAWGIYFREDWDWVKVWSFLAAGFFPPSFLFGVLWSVLRKDVQGAFGVAAWWMAGATIIVGIVGTRSKLL